MMGGTEDVAPSNRTWQGIEKPKHEVAITQGFYIGKYEVTQAQYEGVTGENPSKWKEPNRPVEQVTWHEAAEFCRLATERTRKKVRLPTEAEWEYACRAGETSRWCFGSDEAGLDDYAWHHGNSAQQTHPVGRRKPNAWGLHDMRGNVWEWVADRYAARYYARSPGENPTGPKTGDRRLLRGGSWGINGSSCRSALRDHHPPTYRYRNRGFRAVVSASPVEAAASTRGPARPPGVPPDAAEFGGHWYKVYEQEMSWPDAKAFCERQGGHLVTIASVGENDYAVGLAKRGAVDCWIGFTDEGQEGEWRWITGEAATFKRWADAQPDNWQGDQHVSMISVIRDWQWDDSAGHIGKYFICEWEPAPGGIDLVGHTGDRNEVVLRAVEDTHTKRQTPARNYGDVGILFVDGGGRGMADPDRGLAYLKFRLGVPGKPLSARLRLHVSKWPHSESANGGAVHLVRGDWSEKTLTDEKSPELGRELARVGRTEKGGVIERALPVSIVDRSEVSIAIVPTSADGAGYCSRETAKPAELVVEFEALPGGASSRAGRQADRERGLVGWWKFDEGRGRAANDSSGNGNHGTIHGADWKTRHTGGALRFDGKGDHVELPDLRLTTAGDYSLSAWVRSAPQREWQTIVGKSYARLTYQRGPGAFGAWQAPGDDPRQVKYFRGQRVGDPGRWHHVAMAVDARAGEVRLYVNGKAQKVGSYGKPGAGGFDYRAPWVMGMRNSAEAAHEPQYLHGGLDDVRIYDRALSAGEIAALARGDEASAVGARAAVPDASLGGPGLLGAYYAGENFEKFVLRRVDPKIDFPKIDFKWMNDGPAPGVPSEAFSVRWTGQLRVPADGRYELYIDHDDGVRLRLGDRLIFDRWEAGKASHRGPVDLKAGWVPILIEFFDQIGHATMRLEWSGPGLAKTVIPIESFRTPAATPEAPAKSGTREADAGASPDLERFNALVAKGDYAGAARHARAARHGAAELVAEALGARAKAVRRGAEALVGKDAKLATSKGTHSGEVERVTDDGVALLIKKRLRGGQGVMETKMTVKWSDLAPAEEARLAKSGGWKAAGADAAMAEAVLAALRRDAPAARAALARAGDHPLATHCRARIEARKASTTSARKPKGPPPTLTVNLGRGVTMEMVYVKPGAFVMGNKSGPAPQRPQHQISISNGFYTGKYEVTQAQYRAVTGADPSRVKGPDRPVETVSWFDAAEFCKQAAERTRLPFRLPTEAEWEYACRAGSTGTWCFGNDQGKLLEYAYLGPGFGAPPRPVGEGKPNAWGLCDMHGNVREWCSDWYSPDYYAKSPAKDPTGPAEGVANIQRGGCAGRGIPETWSSGRVRDGPHINYPHIGLRAV
ncbi:MAG: SUMF1/EgtB/PvdO family nonheme iron enzyme, partial [Planctomycetota bacterium]